VVAAFLLQQLLGGFNMLDSLESMDKYLVLSPKMLKEDEHLLGLGLSVKVPQMVSSGCLHHR
jgi:hypothetical protein